MTRYVQGVNPPWVGTKATVYELDKQTETTVGAITDEGLVVLFKGQKGEEPAGQAANGEWYTARTDNLVVFAHDVMPGDEFHTVNDGGTQEIWRIQSERNGELFAIQLFDDVEITRRFARDRRGTWVCIDDPDFTEITHKPVPPLGIVMGTGPHTGDLTTRVVQGRSLLFRVLRIETRDRYKVAILTWINAPASATDTQTQVYWTPEMGEWRWNDAEEKVVFTSGTANEVALKATRLDALRKTLRAKYFHYEAMAHSTPPEFTTADAIRDEIAEALFLIETGLRPDQTWDTQQFSEFYEGLHDEYLASIEQ